MATTLPGLAAKMQRLASRMPEVEKRAATAAGLAAVKIIDASYERATGDRRLSGLGARGGGPQVGARSKVYASAAGVLVEVEPWGAWGLLERKIGEHPIGEGRKRSSGGRRRRRNAKVLTLGDGFARVVVHPGISAPLKPFELGAIPAAAAMPAFYDRSLGIELAATFGI